MSDDQAAVIVELSGLFKREGIAHWLFGGWAVDYHAGKVTRPHSDVDFVVWKRDHEAIVSLLERLGFEAEPSLLAFRRNDTTFEITLIERTPGGAIVTPGFEFWPWSAGTFGDDLRSLHGVPVPVVTLSGMLDTKEGWQTHFEEPPRPQDSQDIELLRRLQSE